MRVYRAPGSVCPAPPGVCLPREWAVVATSGGRELAIRAHSRGDRGQPRSFGASCSERKSERWNTSGSRSGSTPSAVTSSSAIVWSPASCSA